MTVPASIERLPKHGALPIPYFTLTRKGKPDFRFHDAKKHNHAMEARLCGVCGLRCKPFEYWFLLGPMQYLTRAVTYMPACHEECLRWSLHICPWLAGKTERRTDAGLPKQHVIGDSRVVCASAYSATTVPESGHTHLYASLGSYTYDEAVTVFLDGKP